VLHHIWLGGQPIPDALQTYRESWLRLHPNWQHELWTDENIGPLVNQRQFDAAPTPAKKSHIARYEILHREGGVYVDFDVECRKPLDDLLPGHAGFGGAEDDNTVGIAVLGATPGESLLAVVINALPHAVASGFDPPHQSGSWFFTPHLLSDHTWRLFWWDKFYPRHWSGRIEASLEHAHAVHYWEASWNR
jgi:mannosyltransferase OCH1-like enzyme